MDDCARYETPTANLPCTTPASTPHRVAYRMNPVKLVRQQVPLKLQPSQSSGRGVFPDRDSMSSHNNMNPMKTKRIKCVIQPTPLYQDGVGDQSPSPRDPVVEQLSSRLPLANASSQDEVNNFIRFSDYTTPKTSPHGSGQRSQCNPRGDAESVDKPVDDNSAQSIYYSSETHDKVVKFNVPEMLRSVAAVEKEVESIESRLERVCDPRAARDEQTNAKECSQAIKRTDEASKSKKDEKQKAAVAQKATIPPDPGNGTHGCEKKKFYDPQDIRKYMMKKKNERRAKEKEEKCKKASEQAALKRKAEVTKSFTQRTKFPGCKNNEQGSETVNAKMLKNSKNFNNENMRKEMKSSVAAKPKQEVDRVRNDDQRVLSCHGSKALEQGIESRLSTGCDFNDIEKTGKYFEEKFNDVIEMCTNEVNKIVNLNLQNSSKGLKMKQTERERIPKDSLEEVEKVVDLPVEIDALKYKDSYNFLDVLKSKINLARSTKTNSFDAFPACKTRPEGKAQFVGGMLEKRRRVETQPKVFIQPELTLSDLNLSPQKRSDTFIISDFADRGNRTYVVVADNELKRKSPKSSLNFASKENREGVGLEMSGVRPLVPSGGSMSSPPAEKNVVQNLVEKSKEVAGSEDLSTLANRNQCPVKKFSKSEATLMKTSNWESLKTPNVSVSLPQSWICNDDSKPSFEEEGTEDHYDNCEFPNDESARWVPNEIANMTSTVLLSELYDQMIKSEDEKLSQILLKIQQQKEALNRYLKTEIFTLELQKNQYREKKEEEKIKALKKKQRAVLLRVTKNILELEKMKKSVTATVDQRKIELAKQRALLKEGKTSSRLRQLTPKTKKRTESLNTAYMVSSQTILGISTSSCTSVILDNDSRDEMMERIDRETTTHNGKSEMRISSGEHINLEKNIRNRRKDTAPVHFKNGISIRVDLNSDEILRLKDSYPRTKSEENLNEPDNVVLAIELPPRNEGPSIDFEDSLQEDSVSENDVLHTSRNKSIKIKRPLAPIVFSPSKRILHSRRQSSGSDLTLPSFNDTTTDQSDLEARISALQEQLTQRKLEAERLRKEEKKLRKEKLRTKEQSLLKQLEAYDQYIERLSKLLAENKNILYETSKPQIKFPSATAHKRANKNARQDGYSETAAAGAETSFVQNDDRAYIDDAETNTEDSEKQLRKTDSGILIESEVTEVSENVDPHAIVATEEETRSSTESVVRVDASGQRDTSARDSNSTMVVNTKNQFLQMVNDLQSEVLSISEQFYSSDFVEDIPEDLVDTKSEVSENVTNENNTSMSIEEILSDNHSDASERVAPAEAHTRQESVGTSTGKTIESVTEDVKTVESVLASAKQVEGYQSLATDANELVSLPSKISSPDERLDEVSEPPMVGVETSDDQSDLTLTNEKRALSKESTSNEEFDFYNVKNISAIESLEEDTKIPSEADVASIQKSEPTLTRDNDGSAIDIVEEIRSASSLERVSEEDKATPEGVVFDAENKVLNIEALFSQHENAIPSDPAKPERKSSDKIEENAVPQRQQTLIWEYGTEETDVSESLEYDGVVVDPNSDHSVGQVIHYDENDRNVNSALLEAASNTSNGSPEEDRSVGEIIENHSIPNVLGDTFITHDDEAASDAEKTEESKDSPIITSPADSAGETKVNQDDLDVKITKGQTPFLQALRRDQENLMAKEKCEAMEKVTMELMDTLMKETKETYENSINAIMSKNRDRDLDNTMKDNLNSEFGHEEESKIAEELEKKHPESFSPGWYDKLDLTEARLREAEELRLQQMKIEQEIEELQAQQHTPPYVYFREIPNKPPPPYTPPSGLARIPGNEYELQDYLQPIIEKVCEQMEEGEDPKITEIFESSRNSQVHRDVIMYKQFLFDLTKEVAQSLLKEQETTQVLPWEELSSKNVARGTKPEGKQLQEMVKNRIDELFGFRSKLNREKLIIQWSRKKKTDFVDDLLIQELQDEEDEWVNYEKDELSIKNQITESLLNELITDTVVSLQDAFQKKKQFF